MISKRIKELKDEIKRCYVKMEVYSVDKQANYDKTVDLQNKINEFQDEIKKLRFRETLETKIALNK